MELTTRRLTLVPLGRDHRDDLHALYADRDVTRYIGGSRLTPEVIDAQLDRFAGVWERLGYGQSAVVERATGAFVGRVGLHPWEAWDEIELGWVVARGRQRRGYASEAARAWIGWAERSLGADHLIAVIQPQNAASIRTAAANGFAYDRDDTTPWADVVVYRRALARAPA